MGSSSEMSVVSRYATRGEASIAHHLHLGAPDAFADEIEAFLTGDPPKPGGERILATILFTDMVESTRLLVASGDRRWRDVLDAHDGLIDTELARYGGHRVQGTGDGVLATFDGPARAISCASDLNRGLQRLGLDIRTGIHVGEVERRGDDIAGIAVVIAARVNALAGAGEILVSRTVKDLVAGSGIRFAPKGAHTLKGIDEKWDLYAVERTP